MPRRVTCAARCNTLRGGVCSLSIRARSYRHRFMPRTILAFLMTV